MRLRRTLVSLGVLSAAGLGVGLSAVPAGASNDAQTFHVTVYEVYPNGTSQGTGPVRAAGEFNGFGVDQEVASLPSDPANSSRDVLQFATGALDVLSTGGTGGAPTVTAHCTFVFTIHGLQTTVVGGTGVFAHAIGHFTDTLNVAGALPRNPDGSCNTSQSASPLFDTVSVVARGHLEL